MKTRTVRIPENIYQALLQESSMSKVPIVHLLARLLATKVRPFSDNDEDISYHPVKE